MEFINNNWPALMILLAVVLIYIIYAIIQIKRSSLRTYALAAILKAEESLNSTTGKEKMNIAINYVYDLLPAYIKLLLPTSLIEEYLRKFIQKVFDEVKQLLDYTPEINEKESES